MGIKCGCDMGICGCCVVIVDGCFVFGCLMFVVDCEGKIIEIIELVVIEEGFYLI